jgi:DNA-binding response OmpR family regulator
VTRRGFEPLRAYCGRDGISQAQAHRPDLMLLDLMLPDVDGFEVCMTLRTHRETNLIPIVMTTALTATDQRLRGFRVGANCYVTKPYTSEDVFSAIDEALAWKSRMIVGQTEGELSFDVAGDAKYLLEVNDLLSSLFLLTPLEERAATELCQAVWEIGQAAIEWTQRKPGYSLVEITYRLHPDRVTVTIRDKEHLPFTAVDRAPLDADPIVYLTICQIIGLRGGRPGPDLVARGLVDDLEYSDAGDQISLIKRFTPAGGGRM